MENMSAGELKEVISIVGITLLIVAIVLISWSRRKLTGIIGAVITLIAYICFIVGGLIVVFVVISGPTG